MKKILFICIGIIGCAFPSTAQMISANYQISVPLGELKEYTDHTSFRGANVDYHYFFKDNFSLGLSVGWNLFTKDTEDVTAEYTFKDNITYLVTGHEYKYLNTIPIVLSGRFYPTKFNSRVRPYFGWGIGTQWSERRVDIGVYYHSLTRWQFTMYPEIGMYIPFSNRFAFNFAVKYNYATPAANGRIPEYQTFSFNIGMLLLNFD